MMRKKNRIERARKGASQCVSRHVVRAETLRSIDQGAAQRPRSEARASQARTACRASGASPAPFLRRPDAGGDVRAPPNFATGGGKDRGRGLRRRRFRGWTRTSGGRGPFSTRYREVRGSPSAAAVPGGPGSVGTLTRTPVEASRYRPSVRGAAFRPPHPASARRAAEANAATVAVA